MRQCWVLREPSQRLTADVSLTDVPMAIDARVVRCARIIEMDRPNFPEADRTPDDVDRRLQTIAFANVVSGSERMRVSIQIRRGICGHRSMIERKCSKRWPMHSPCPAVFSNRMRSGPNLKPWQATLRLSAQISMASASQDPRALPG